MGCRSTDATGATHQTDMKRTNEQIQALPEWVNLNGLCRASGVTRNTLLTRVARNKPLEEVGEALAKGMLPYVHLDDVNPLLEALAELLRLADGNGDDDEEMDLGFAVIEAQKALDTWREPQ